MAYRDPYRDPYAAQYVESQYSDSAPTHQRPSYDQAGTSQEYGSYGGYTDEPTPSQRTLVPSDHHLETVAKETRLSYDFAPATRPKQERSVYHISEPVHLSDPTKNNAGDEKVPIRSSGQLMDQGGFITDFNVCRMLTQYFMAGRAWEMRGPILLLHYTGYITPIHQPCSFHGIGEVFLLVCYAPLPDYSSGFDHQILALVA